jgi:hypothetical protein
VADEPGHDNSFLLIEKTLAPKTDCTLLNRYSYIYG